MSWLKRILAAIHRRPGRALAIYWLIAFLITHIPRFGPMRNGPKRYPIDKLFHVACYAVLAWLLMLLLSRRMRPAAAAVLAILIIATYGALDEITQPLINRNSDLRDYFADIAGGVIGTALGLVWGPGGHARIQED